MSDSATPVERDEAAPSVPSRIGPYELGRPIGRGGMGAVYEARHVNLDRVVALKVLTGDPGDDPTSVARFRREMRLAAAIDSPHVVRALDGGELEGVHFLVMELVAGSTLTEIGRAVGPFSLADACEVAYQVATGLQHVHDGGLVHRDLKPANVMLDRDGVARILDLGIARPVGVAVGDELTATNQVMGTADYIAPEQVASAKDADIRADLYSLGCTLFKLLAGRAPFEKTHRDFMGKVIAHREESPPRLSDVVDVPDEIDELVGRLLEKSPEDRPSTPDEILPTLEPFRAGASLAALVARCEGQGQKSPAPLSAFSTVNGTGAAVATAEHAVDPYAPTRAAPGPARRLPLIVALVSTLGLACGLALWFNRPGEDGEDPIEKPAIGGGSGEPGTGEEKPKDEDEQPKPLPLVREATIDPVLELDGLAPKRWHDLLVEEPVRLAWPHPERGSRFDFDPRERMLFVDCRTDVSLFALGRTKVDEFDVTLRTSQTNWSGGVGVFLGLAPAKDERGRVCLRGQFLTFLQTDPSAYADGFQLQRGILTVYFDEEGHASVGRHSICGAKLEGVVGEQTIELKCEDGRLRAVYVGGRLVEPVTDLDCEADFDSVPVHGAFGTMNVRCAAEFRRAEFLKY